MSDLVPIDPGNIRLGDKYLHRGMRVVEVKLCEATETFRDVANEEVYVRFLDTNSEIWAYQGHLYQFPKVSEPVEALPNVDQTTLAEAGGPWDDELICACDSKPERRPSPSETPFEQAVSGVFVENEELLLRKHHDYGPQNISRSPGGALNGLRVRMWDKLARINNLIDSGATPENESLRDSFQDLSNYGVIAQLVLDGDWPDE